MKKEFLSLFLVKIILISALIIFGGALFGAIMYLAINYSMPIRVPEIAKAPDKETIKTEAQKYLPKDYSIISDKFLYYENIDKEKGKEIIVLAEKRNEATEALFILKKGILGYGVVKEFSASAGNFFEEALIKDINGNKIPEIIYIYAAGSGETMPRTVKIFSLHGKDYDLLFSKTITVPYAGRPEIKNWSKNLVKDLNDDGRFEIIIPDVGVYQAFCGNSGVCLSLFDFTVYEQDGDVYVFEATDKFLEVYKEEIKLANNLLNNAKTTESGRIAIQKYLQRIEDIKNGVRPKVYRNDNLGFEISHSRDWKSYENGEEAGIGKNSSLPRISVKKFKIEKEQNFQDILISNTMLGECGDCHPEFQDFEIRKIGNNKFYYIYPYLSEGQFGVSYWAVKDNFMLEFGLYDDVSGVEDWMSDKFDIEKQKSHLELKEILATFKFVE